MQHLRLDAVCPRVGPQETHLGPDSPKSHQCLADPLVVDVPLAVDREAVVPEPGTVWAGLDPGQVDATRRELLEQATGAVLAWNSTTEVLWAPVGAGT